MYFGPLVTLLPYSDIPHSLPQLHPSPHRRFAAVVCSFRYMGQIYRLNANTINRK